MLKKLIRRLFRRRNKFKKRGANLKIVRKPIYVINRNVIIGDNVSIFPGTTFFGRGPIVIGDNVKIGNNVIINAMSEQGIVIKDYTSIAANTYIIDNNHMISKHDLIQKQGVDSKPIIIGEDVWIGASCVIGKGSFINKGAVIGANSFVNSEIDSYAIAVGNPARVIKYRK